MNKIFKSEQRFGRGSCLAARGVSSEEAREAVSPLLKLNEKTIDIAKIKQRKYD